ncbi:MAG: glycosyltransferase family 4 protein [Candidatus Galacturonibacter soehngenii]|nr:glycosyltransferase family 4 protein [Candidatus Galacturonibacter soehngenii]
MKKKLLVTASTFPRYEGDSEPRFVLDLCKELNRYFDVTVLVPAAIGAKDKEILEGIKVIRYHYFPIKKYQTLCYPGAIVPRIKEKKIRILLVPFLFLALFCKLFQILPNYDVVHAHWILPQGIVQGFFKKPYILTGHGGDVTSLNKGILRVLKKKALKNASYVTTVSSALMEEVNKIYKVKKSDVISMGCNVKNFSSSFRKENYFSQNNKKIVLFVGRLAEKKGVTYLIAAMKSVDAKLIIAGDGPLESTLREQASEYGEKIEFIGAKTHEELKIIYASSDIFVAPSVTATDGDKEGFGLVILEAMASGLPVIASKSGGIPDLLTDGQEGYLTKEKDPDDIAEKINIVLNDNQLYDRMSLNAIHTAQKYDYKLIAQKYARIIDNIEKG